VYWYSVSHRVVLQVVIAYRHENLQTSTYIAHSWSWALLEKAPIVQLLKKFPEFYGTRRFITVFTRALHWSPSFRLGRWIRPGPRLEHFHNKLIFLQWGVGKPTPNPQAGWPHLVGCPWLLIQYIRSYLEGVSSIHCSQKKTLKFCCCWSQSTWLLRFAELYTLALVCI
jgi:hypothetical protein